MRVAYSRRYCDRIPVMRFFALVALAMTAFAANSVLNRMALATDAISPTEFAGIRTLAGAVTLLFLLAVQRRRPPLIKRGRALGVVSLTIYMLGFSLAYLTLDAGLGALILFGMVQLTMFVGGLLGGERVPAARWAGAVIALGGLAFLLWPVGATAPDPLGGVLMGVAGIGWGVYSLAGRNARDPLAETGANFVLAAPLTLVPLLLISGGADPGRSGIVLAIISGAITSGLGYALWYRVLPRLVPSLAAIAQLTVPVLAALGGVAFLGEAPSARFALATFLVLGGVALSVAARDPKQVPN